MVKEGVPASLLVLISEDMAISKDKLYTTIGLARATVNRKLREQQMLSQDESERVLGIARLVGQVSTMVKESGRPEGFSAAKWVAMWLDQPQPALGGKRPAELMDTADGRGIVSDLIARMQSGAYA
jgi:putative toxin-antitoxin system antitoxin component (TIGR02293 family)